MQQYEYKVVPAPRRGQKAKGAKGTDERFALTLQTVMNDLAAKGWEYLRAETLPSEERSGLTGRTTVEQSVLVFRRALAEGTRPEAASGDTLAKGRAPATGRAEPRLKSVSDAADLTSK